MKKIYMLTLMCIIVFALFSKNAYGNTVGYYFEKELDQIGVDGVEVEEEINGKKISFGEMVKLIIDGKVDVSAKDMLKNVSVIFSDEIKNQMGFIKKIVIVAVLSALLKNISESFKEKSVAELSFFICYIVLVIFIMSGFSEGLNIVKESSEKIFTSMQAMVPAFMSAVFISGKGGMAASIYPLIAGISQILTVFINKAIIPVISASITLHMVNYISEKGYLTQFSKLLYGISKWLLRGTAIGFMAVLSLYRLGTPVLNQLLGKGTKAALEAIPVVGDVMGGAMEIAAALTKSIGSGMAAAAIIFLGVMAAIPILKLLIMGFIFKLTAAFSEPICQERVIKALASAGDFIFMLIGILFVSEAIFIFSIIILVSIL